MVVGNNDIYVIGGFTRIGFLDRSSFALTPQISSNEVWLSSDGGLTWDQAAGATRFTERGNHESVVLDGALYVIAGAAGNLGVTGLNDVWKSTDRGISWSRVTPEGKSVEFPMDYSFASAVLGTEMYVMEGIQRTPFTRLDQVWKSTNQGVTWTQATNATDPKFSARSQHAAVVLESAGAAKLYVIGGSSSGATLGTLFNDVWRSTDGVTWVNVHKNL